MSIITEAAGYGCISASAAKTDRLGPRDNPTRMNADMNLSPGTVTRQAQQPDAPDDTVKVVQVTDRTRASRSEGYRDREEKIVVKTDTVYIEKTDTLTVSSKLISGKPDSVSDKQTGLVPTLKWIFGCIIALIALLITLRILKR